MIDKNLIKKIMKSITRREVGLSDHQIMHPMREWFLGLFIALICLAVAIFLCVKLYWHYSSLKPSSGSNKDTQVVIYRAEEIEAALTELEARNKAYTEIKSNLTTRTELPPVITPTETSTTSVSEPEPEEAPTETPAEAEALEDAPTPILGGQ